MAILFVFQIWNLNLKNNMKLKEEVILILTPDGMIDCKQNPLLYNHYEYYQYLDKTSVDFRTLLLGYYVPASRSEWQKKENDILDLLTMQGCIVFENGNTCEAEDYNMSILYLPDGELSEFQISTLEFLSFQFENLPYLEVIKRNKDELFSLNELYKKHGPEVLNDLVLGYRKNHFTK